MSWVDASTFLAARTARNRVVFTVKRLRNPRYLIGAALGLFWLYTSFLRQAFSARFQPDHSGFDISAGRVFIEGGTMALGVALVLFMWLFGRARTVLRFSEPEVEFLFAGPLSREQLLHYRLSRTLGGVFFSSLVTTFFLGGGLKAARPVASFLGMTLAYMLLSLHGTGVSFLRKRLLEHGRRGWLRALPVLTLGVVALVAGVAFLRRAHWPAFPAQVEVTSMANWAEAVLRTRPLSLFLWPFRAPLDVAFARTPSELLHALPAPLLLVALHYVWVMRSSVAFEEDSLEVARERAERAERRQSGRSKRSSGPVRAAMVRLPALGWPAAALAWKNLLVMQRASGLKQILRGIALLAVAVALMPHLLPQAKAVVGLSALAFSAFGAAGLAVLGPVLLRVDLRQSLRQLDLLKSLPLTGRQLLYGEMFAPWAVLVLVELCLLLAAAVLSPQAHAVGIAVAGRFALLGSGVVMLPVLTAAVLTILNGAAALFPAWMTAEPGDSRGIEATGQRMLNLLATLLALLAGMLPSVILGGGVGWVSYALGLRWSALLLGVSVATGVLAVETLVVWAMLGRVLDSLDPAEEG